MKYVSLETYRKLIGWPEVSVHIRNSPSTPYWVRREGKVLSFDPLRFLPVKTRISQVIIGEQCSFFQGQGSLYLWTDRDPLFLQLSFKIDQVCPSGTGAFFTSLEGYCCYLELQTLLQGFPNPIQVSPRVLSIRGIVTSIASGQNHTLFLLETGAVYGLGHNDYGQLGLSYEEVCQKCGSEREFIHPYPDGTDEPRRLPLSVRVRQIYTGANHSLLQSWNRGLLTMGKNNFGQLGREGDCRIARPLLTIRGKILQAAAGGDHTLLQTAQGTVWSLGIRGRKQILFKRNIASFATNGVQSIFSTLEGEVLVWGDRPRRNRCTIL